MSNGRRKGLAFCAVTLLFIGYTLSKISHAGTPPPSVEPIAPKAQLIASMMKAPISFEANQGQTDETVNFIARGDGYNLFLTPTESVMVIQQRVSGPANEKSQANINPSQKKLNVVRMKLEGANPQPAIEGVEQLPGLVNYFIGNDPSKWHANIPTYAKVQYREAYPGIDVAYYGNQGKLEYDFIVAPGADPNKIKLAFEGASKMRVTESGDL
jgi:hypothetical protein